MCDPVSLTVGVATAAASAAAQGAAQSRAAKDQNRYRAQLGSAQNEAYEKTVESVVRDVGLQTDALVAQQQQNIDAQKQQLQGISRDARSASSTMRAIGAEAGVEGRTVEMVHQQFEREVLEFESAATRNISNMTAQVNREAQAIYSRGQSIINSGYPSPLPPPARVDWGLIGVNSAITGVQTGIALNGAFKNPQVGNAGGTFNGSANTMPSRAGIITGVR
jgi:hypothetical protein